MTVAKMILALKTIVCGAACLLFAQGQAQTLAELLQNGYSLQHAVIPLYSETDRQLSTVVHVDKAFLDYQRKGFFRIGILPMGALEGVTFEVRNAASAPRTLHQLGRWLGGGDGSRVELRQVKFLYQTNSLEAGRVQVRSADRWDLFDGVRMVCGGAERRASRATLEISGQRAGQVVLDAAPDSTNAFLGLNLNSSP
ncbi:MAG: hypothetical protein ABSG59_03365 [Verrucomicrobiota bacterium]